MAYATLDDIVGEVRVLLQDTDADGYRYDTASIYQALNEGIIEAFRLRPDFYRGLETPPQYTNSDRNDDINFPVQYRPSLVNYTCGRVQLRDDDVGTDQRAGIFITSFKQALVAGS